MQKKTTFLTLVLFCVAGVVFYSKTKNEPTPQQTQNKQQAFKKDLANGSFAKDLIVKQATEVMGSTPSLPDTPFLASGLLETEIDGSLRFDQRGNLILDQSVRDFFDYFLSAADEIGPATAIAEIQRYIDQYLPTTAAHQAHSLLANYLRYKQFEIQLQSQPISSDADTLAVMEHVFALQKQRRENLFSEQERAALFALEEAHQSFTLESLRLYANESIGDLERQHRLASLENTLPVELQRSRKIGAQQKRTAELIAASIVNSKDTSTLHEELLQQGLSRDKADQIVAYTQQNADFEQRYKLYRNARARINKESKGFTQEVDVLKRQFFVSSEELTKASLRDLSL